MNSRSSVEDEDEEREDSYGDLHPCRGAVQLQGRLSRDVLLTAGRSLSDLSSLDSDHFKVGVGGGNSRLPSGLAGGEGGPDGQ